MAVNPWWKSKTFWTGVVGFLAAVPSFAHDLTPFVSPAWQHRLAAVAVAATFASIWMARLTGIVAAAQAQRGTD